MTKLDRLGRNTGDVLATVDRLDCIGVHVHCLALTGVDLTSASGKLHMTVLAAVAQVERDLLIELTLAGLARAKAEGKKLGRRDSLTDEQKAEIRAKLAEGSTVRGLAKDYGVSHPTIRGRSVPTRHRNDESRASLDSCDASLLHCSLVLHS